MGRSLEHGNLVFQQGYLFGLTLSTAGSSTTFSVAAGEALDSTNNTGIMTLGSSISKTTSAWTVGTGNGGLDTGSIAASTWYHAYLIKRPDTGVVDVLVSLSASAPTMPTNYTLKRRIGAMKTNGSSQWTKFVQLGDDFLWDTPPTDFNGSFSTTATLYTLSVPTGIQVIAHVYGANNASGNIYLLFSSPDQADTTPSSTNTNSPAASSVNSLIISDIRTNTSGQIRGRISSGTATGVLLTGGWIDNRGRLF